MTSLVSIVLCTFNGERYLAAQLDSLLKQDYPNLEIIISDDASKDSTCEILKRYEADQRVKVFVNKENKGFVKNFEHAVNFATGEYISFCDQDDIWLPEKVSASLSAIGNHTMVYCDSAFIDDKGNATGKNMSGQKRMQNAYDSRMFIFSNAISGHAMIFHRSLLKSVLPLPAGIQFHDWLFAARAASLDGIVYLDQPLVRYRLHQQNVSAEVLPKSSGKSRSGNQRYKEFQTRLHWIETLMKFAEKKHLYFYQTLHSLYARKKHGRFVWPLFTFLIRHWRVLFTFNPKNFVSTVIDIRKIARGEKSFAD